MIYVKSNDCTSCRYPENGPFILPFSRSSAYEPCPCCIEDGQPQSIMVQSYKRACLYILSPLLTKISFVGVDKVALLRRLRPNPYRSRRVLHNPTGNLTISPTPAENIRKSHEPALENNLHLFKPPDSPCPRCPSLPSSTDSPFGSGSKSSSAAHPAPDSSGRSSWVGAVMSSVLQA